MKITKQEKFDVAMRRVGGRAGLANRLNCTRQAVDLWFKNGCAPVARLRSLSRVLGLPLRDIPLAVGPDWRR